MIHHELLILKLLVLKFLSFQYVRVKNDTDVNQLMQMMLDKWNMEKPNLLISVTGGAKNFRLKPRLKEVFRHGLIKAADSTGAWIVTGGTNAGVMKHVGEAIRDSAIARGASKTPLVAIGIATWGCINNREILVNKNVNIVFNYFILVIAASFLIYQYHI